MQLIESPQLVIAFLTGVLATILTGGFTAIGKKITSKAAEIKEEAPKYIFLATLFILVIFVTRSKTTLDFTDSLIAVSFCAVIPALFIFYKRREKQ